MSYLLALLLLLVGSSSHQKQDSRIPFKTIEVDTIDVNHVCPWDREAGFEEQLCQILFWGSGDEGYGVTYFILDWIMVFDDGNDKLIIPSHRKLKNGKIQMVFEYSGKYYVIIAERMVETFTQFDPEQEENKALGWRDGLWHKR